MDELRWQVARCKEIQLEKKAFPVQCVLTKPRLQENVSDQAGTYLRQVFDVKLCWMGDCEGDDDILISSKRCLF